MPVRNNFFYLYEAALTKKSFPKFTNLFIIFQVELVNDSLYEWNLKIMRVDPDLHLVYFSKICPIFVGSAFDKN